MPIREPDLYTSANLIGGLPVCVFSSKPYRRFVTNIVVENGVPSNVDCYVGSLTSYPVATSKLGDKNTLSGRIVVPAGQPFFVRWSAAPPDLTTAFARVSFERDDNPLGEVSNAATWREQLVDSLTIPSNAGPNDKAIVIGQQIPDAIKATEAPWTVHAVEIYRFNDTVYLYDALVSIGSTFGLHRGYVFGTSGAVLISADLETIAALGNIGVGDTEDIEQVRLGGAGFAGSTAGIVLNKTPFGVPTINMTADQIAPATLSLLGTGTIDAVAQTINLDASTRIDFGNSTKTLQNGFVNARMLIANSILHPTADVTLTTSTQILPTANLTITIPNHGARWAAVGVFDLEWNTPDTQNDAVGILQVDGVEQPGVALLRSNEAGESTDQRATVSQVWSGFVSGGNHTWRLGARKDGAGGSAACNSNQTNCLLQVFS